MAFLDHDGLVKVWNKMLEKVNAKADSSHDHNSISGTASNVTGVVGIANGGTGASDASTARKNIGAMEANPNTIELGTQLTTAFSNGGIIDFHYQGSTANYTSRIMEIEKGVIKNDGSFYTTGYLQSLGGLWLSGGSFFVNSDVYGTSLPAAGNKGRVFFKKV